jgi:integrase
MGREATRKTNFTELGVKKLRLPPKGQQVDYFERLERGRNLVLRLSYGGARSWRVGYYIAGKAQAFTLGRWLPEGKGMSVATARAKARSFDPKAATLAAEAGTFQKVAEDWITDYVERNRLRSQDEIKRILKVYVYPKWATRKLYEIKRFDVKELLMRIEDKHGAPQADCVLATLRSLMNWFQIWDENYVSPIVKGMKRDQRKDKARDRTLTDDEIRAVWAGCDAVGTFGALVKLLLLTAQRLDKVVKMKRTDISDDGVWTIPTEDREKGNAGKLRLPELALAVIASQPIIDYNPHIFPSVGRYRKAAPHFNSGSQRKRDLDALLPAGTPHWTLHDLRRTARSLMARVGVADNIAERVLGHAIGGVEGIYNRHAYFDEKADALQRLATLVDTIINPPDQTNVVPLAAARR